MPPKRSAGDSPSPRRQPASPASPAIPVSHVGTPPKDYGEPPAVSAADVDSPAAPVAAPVGSLGAEVWLQLRLATPATITYLFGRSLVSICLIFIGRMGDLELAAAALANTTSNVSGLSIMVGMGTAVSTICGQAYGAGNHRKVAEMLQLALWVNWAVCIPISILWWNAEAILIVLGQDPSVSSAAGDYIRWLIPFIWCFAAQGAFNAWLNAQRIMKPGAAASVMIAPIHLGVCMIVFNTMGRDYIGGAQAMTVSGAIQTLLLVMIVWCFGMHKKTWFGLLCPPASTADTLLYCKLAFAGVISLSEWWASEICILMAGLLPRPEYTVATMSIFQITIGQCFYFPLGVGIACSTRVANLLGGGQPAAAKQASQAAILTGSCVLGCLFVLMQVMRFKLPLVYTDDPVLAQMMADNFFVAAFYIVGDGLCVINGSVLRGCGLQVMAAKVVVFSYYIVAIPMSYYLGFHTDMGVVGLAWGITLGTYVHSGIYAFLVSRIDWEAQSRIAVARSGGGSGGALKAEERSKEKQSLLAGGDDEDDD